MCYSFLELQSQSLQNPTESDLSINSSKIQTEMPLQRAADWFSKDLDFHLICLTYFIHYLRDDKYLLPIDIW